VNAFWHVAVALLCCGALSLVFPVALSPQLAAVILLGALAPFCAAALAYLTLPEQSRILGAIIAAIAVILFVLLLKPRHRGVTHSLLALLVFSAVVFALTRSQPLAIYGGAAFLSHLIADAELKLA